MDGNRSSMNGQNTREQLFANRLKVHRRNFCTNGIDSYFPLYLRALMVGEKLSFSLYVKVSGEDSQEVKFLPFLEAEEILEPAWVEMLKRLGIDRFYFRRDDLDLVIAYLNNHLLLLDSRGEVHPKEKLSVLVEHLNFSLRRCLNSPHLGQHIHLAHLQMERLIQELGKDADSLKLVWELLYQHYTLYNHSLNVCLLGTGLMLFMHKSRSESLIVGLACLFHDLGLTRIPEEILYRSDPLTPGEKETIMTHPQLGYQMLKETNLMPKEIMQLVLEHHENADGSGYPQRLVLVKQHPWTRIIRLVDAYDGLSGHRPYRQALKPFAALKTLQDQAGPEARIFDHRTLVNFIRFLAVP